jgi:hypothetical protein
LGRPFQLVLSTWFYQQRKRRQETRFSGKQDYEGPREKGGQNAGEVKAGQD